MKHLNSVILLGIFLTSGLAKAESVLDSQTVIHPTCKIYLPIQELYFRGTHTESLNVVFGSNSQDHWTHLVHYFEQKGYQPERRLVNQLPSIQDEAYLIGNIHHNYDMRTNFHNSRRCDVRLELKQFVDKKLVPFYSKKASQRDVVSNHLSERTRLPRCEEAEQSVFSSIPNCQIEP